MATKRRYTEAVARTKRKYDVNHYYQPTIRIPKELEQAIRDKSNGSVNGYIVGLIKKDLGITDENKKGTP